MSLAVGEAFKFLTSEDTYSDALKLQSEWRASLGNLSPWSLASIYWADVRYIIDGGDWTWAPPKDRATPAAVTDQPPMPSAGIAIAPDSDVQIDDTACETLFNTKNVDCNPDGLRDDPEWSPDRCEAIVAQAARDYEQSCQQWDEQRQGDGLPIAVPPTPTFDGMPEPQRDENFTVRALSAPFAAVYRTWTRLTYEGGWNYVWAFLQLGLGVIGFMIAYAAVVSDSYPKEYFPRNIWAWISVVPAGIVIAASLLAFCFKYLMLGGLVAFGWFAELAGLCCGATSVGGFCWYCFHKFAEYSVSDAIGSKLK